MDYAYEGTHAGLKVQLAYDLDRESPLDDDADTIFITYRAGARTVLGNTPLDQEAHEDIGKRIASGELIGLAVYAYIHGGVALSTAGVGQFADRWDGGQSGFVYVTKETALSWHGGKRLTAKKRAHTLNNLATAVSEYGEYLNGSCYGYIIEDEHGAHLDSCWGFIGYDYALQEARSAAEYEATRQREGKRKAWRAALTEARERRYWLNRGVVTQ